MPSRSRPVFWSPRASACLLCLTTVLALTGSCAPSALAAGLGSSSALSKLTEEQEPETTTTTTATTTSSEPKNSDTLVVLILGAAVVLLSAIAFAIVRDARRVAPATATEMIEAGAAQHSPEALRKRRAKAKAARKQRKRNR